MAFPKSVEWTELAISDYFKLLDYLSENWGEAVVEKFVNNTIQSIDYLSQFPKIFIMVNKRKRVRRCVLSKHNSIYYIEKRDRIQILRLYDNRADPKKLEF